MNYKERKPLRTEKWRSHMKLLRKPFFFPYFTDEGGWLVCDDTVERICNTIECVSKTIVFSRVPNLLLRIGGERVGEDRRGHR